MRRRTWIVAGVVAALLFAGAIALVSTLRYGFSAHDARNDGALDA
jgi:hypothetical protein